MNNKHLVNVIDVEATCWDPKSTHNQQMINEIIEIGISVVDMKACKILSTESILVKPTQSKVSAFCTRLTTLTQEQVDSGISFSDAAEMLRTKYDAGHRLFASYGNYDNTQFRKEFARYNIPNVFGHNYPHCNIKSLFAELLQLKGEVGMSRALHILEIKLEGTHHRGGDDSRNIANILIKLLHRRDSSQVISMNIFKRYHLSDDLVTTTTSVLTKSRQLAKPQLVKDKFLAKPHSFGVLKFTLNDFPPLSR